MRTVVSNPYHLWAHQVQSHATNSGRTKSFDGVSAYSYRAEIGRIVYNVKGERAYLLSKRTYSVTTSKHQSELRRAIPTGAKVFNVHRVDGSDTSVRGQVNLYLAELAELALKARRARTNKEWIQGSIARLLAELREFCEFFGLECPTVGVEASAAELEAAERARRAQEREHEKQRRLEAAEQVAKWQNGELLRLWRHNLSEAYLRVNGDTVETSHGANVPLDHVRRVLPLVLRVIESGEAYRPSEAVRLGHYTLTNIEANGTVRIGCHKILKDEVLRFAALPEVRS